MDRAPSATTPEPSRQRGLLLARQTALTEQLVELRRQLDGVIAATADANTDDEHDPEGSTIAFERSQLVTLIESAAAELDAARDGLTRLAEGRFGHCEECGQPIGDERLAARPATRHCVRCASRSVRR